MYHRYELGQMPKEDKLCLISETCGVSLDWLLTGNPGVTAAELRDASEGKIDIREAERMRGEAIKDAIRNLHAKLEGGADPGVGNAEERERGACANCARLEAEVGFLRESLKAALDRIPRAG